MKKIYKTVLVVFFVILFMQTNFGFFAIAEQSENIEFHKDIDNSEDNKTDTVMKKADEMLSENYFEKLWQNFCKNFKSVFLGFTKKLGTLIFITIITGIISSVSENSSAIYAGEICICSLSFTIISYVCENIIEAMNTLNSFMLSMLPAMTTLYTSSVGVSSATMSYSSTVLFLNISSTLFSSFLLPATKVVIAFSTISLISKSYDFSGFSKFIKSIVQWSFGLVLCLMSAVIFFQSVISTTKDGLASRAIRYAASSLIPVIGSVVSESARTVSESMRLVRSVTGVGGIFAILGIILSPLAALLVCKLYMFICSGLAKLFVNSKVSAYYDEINSVLNLILGACVGVSIVMIIILGIFAKVSVTT